MRKTCYLGTQMWRYTFNSWRVPYSQEDQQCGPIEAYTRCLVKQSWGMATISKQPHLRYPQMGNLGSAFPERYLCRVLVIWPGHPSAPQGDGRSPGASRIASWHSCPQGEPSLWSYPLLICLGSVSQGKIQTLQIPTGICPSLKPAQAQGAAPSLWPKVSWNHHHQKNLILDFSLSGVFLVTHHIWKNWAGYHNK